jgi:hypothetical protein
LESHTAKQNTLGNKGLSGVFHKHGGKELIKVSRKGFLENQKEFLVRMKNPSKDKVSHCDRVF